MESLLRINLLDIIQEIFFTIKHFPFNYLNIAISLKHFGVNKIVC